MDGNMFIGNLEVDVEKTMERIKRIREARKEELCKTCIKTDVCMNDKNLFGDVYVAPNPWFFDEEYRQKAFENYKKRKAEGFPCEHYQPTAEVAEVVRCKDCIFHEDEQPGMVYCPATVGGWVEDDWFCKGGRKMDEVEE